jgi:Fe-S-cluster-containing dehydrogenase component
MERRGFLQKLLWFLGIGLFRIPLQAPAATASATHGASKVSYGMGVDVDKCIGCGKCIEACRTENHVPGDFFHRTWVERYIIEKDGEVLVHSIDSPDGQSGEGVSEQNVLRSFFVPKLCNHCDNPPCVQVCPVGATFETDDGVVLVDAQRCIGCRYCIQACPYGARFFNPVTDTADKCTFCYHRITQGLLPACVEVCPTQARMFGDLKSPASPLTQMRRMDKVHYLKAHLNTEPKVFYVNLDGEVR